MKKALKIAGKVLLGLLIAVVALLACIFIYNRIELGGDRKLIANQQISQMVDVDGKKMSIYVSGEGDHTLVFSRVPVLPLLYLILSPFLSSLIRLIESSLPKSSDTASAMNMTVQEISRQG